MSAIPTGRAAEFADLVAPVDKQGAQVNPATEDTLAAVVTAQATLEAKIDTLLQKLQNGDTKVALYGSFDTLRPMIGATKTASGVASEAFAGVQRLAGRRGLAIKNEHPYLRIRIDGAAVTDTTGIALEPFAQAVFALDPAVDVPVYVISEAGLVKYGVVEW